MDGVRCGDVLELDRLECHCVCGDGDGGGVDADR